MQTKSLPVEEEITGFDAVQYRRALQLVTAEAVIQASPRLRASECGAAGTQAER